MYILLATVNNRIEIKLHTHGISFLRMEGTFQESEIIILFLNFLKKRDFQEAFR